MAKSVNLKKFDWKSRHYLNQDPDDDLPKTFRYTTTTDTIDEIKAADYFNDITKKEIIPAFPFGVADLIDCKALKSGKLKRIVLEITDINFSTNKVTVVDFNA